MKTHTIKTLPIFAGTNFELKYKLVTDSNQLNSTVEVFKIKKSTIIGVDHYNNAVSIRLINSEIEQGIIYIKNISKSKAKIKQKELSLF